jgi:Fe-S-cluster containining protein
MENDRSAWFSLLERVYDETAHPRGELKICTDCADAPCEVGPEQVTLLPFEAEFILGRLERAGVIASLEEVKGIAGCQHCPFFREHRCAIHPHRPVDCRTYPMVPVFAAGSIKFSVSGVCPRRAGMDEPFIRLMADVWENLAPRLPEAWKQGFNARQPRQFLEPLVNIGPMTS